MKKKIDRNNTTQIPVTLSYQQKYEKLKSKLSNVYQLRQGNNQLSPDTLLINTENLDKALNEGTINFKQAYFNLLDTGYKHVKKGTSSVSFQPQEKIDVPTAAKKSTNDIILLAKLPESTEDKYKHTTIITPEGLFQINLGDKGLIGAKNFKPYLCILSKEELVKLGMGEYLEKAGTLQADEGYSVKNELKTNKILYALDQKILESNAVSVWTQRKYHTSYTQKIGASQIEIMGKAIIFPAQTTVVTPAPEGLDGLALSIGPEMKDLLSGESPADKFLIQLFDEIDFLDASIIKEVRAKIALDDESHLAKDLVREIEIAIYDHSKTHPKDKARCFKLLDSYLEVKGTNAEERGFIDQNVFKKEDYIIYKMEQIKIDAPYSPFDKMMALLMEGKQPVSLDLVFSIKENENNLKKEEKDAYLNHWLNIDGGDERSYNTRQVSDEVTRFGKLLKKKNPEIVKAIHSMFQDPKITPDKKAALSNFVTDLLDFEREVGLIQANVGLFQDPSIANATKHEYCTEVKNGIEETKRRIESKHQNLSNQVELLFGQDKKNAKNAKIIGATLAILGAGLVILGIALAVFVAPLAGLVAGAGAVSMVTGAGFFKKASNTNRAFNNTSQLITEVKEFGDKALEANLGEFKEKIPDNKPSMKF